MAKSKTYILDDLPTERDALDFNPYVKTLLNVCKTASTPLTIGIFGTWGSGKTSLMKMIRKGLPKNYTLAWFDAWKYDNEETLWRAFLLTVLLAVEEKSGESEELKNLKTMLYRGLELEKAGGVTIDLEKLGLTVAKGAVKIGLSFIPPLAELTKLVEELQASGTQSLSEGAVDAIRRERTKIFVEQVRSLEQFQDKFKTLVESYVKPGRLVVFVDDLDRCLPEKAIEVLEAIKLFVDAPRCVFILGLDHEVIARGVEIRYKDFVKDPGSGKTSPIDGAKYLEKIIQLPFTIPPVEREDMEEFVTGLASKWEHEECPRVFAEGLGENPRQIKRTVNVFLMLSDLVVQRELEASIQPVRLAKVVAIQSIAPDFYQELLDRPGLLRDVEDYFRAEKQEKGERPSDIGGEQPARPTLPEDLLRLVSGPGLRGLLTMHPLDMAGANFSSRAADSIRPAEIKKYFTLTRRAETPMTTPEEAPRLVFEPQLVTIPEGAFLMGSTPEQAAQAIKDGASEEWVEREQPQHSIELSEYTIGKYPVTNREYQAFVRDVDHKPPGDWNGEQYPPEKGDHPVVNVSWEDAQAYCEWLSEKTKKHYRLPSEAEWEKAARGTDGRVYPWGDEFDPQKANTSESQIGGTTPADQFSPQGDSPYGCADMIGNVWEWCADWYDEQEYKNHTETVVKDPTGPEHGDYRLLRGGSFDSNRSLARCAARLRGLPDGHNWSLGFRVALSPSQKSDR
jgi:formylglycine-generating enzyme required for sulfatase activity